jgi:hypothetical protein
LTVKSDDVDGRTKIYEAMVKNENILEPGTPVLRRALQRDQGPRLNIELHKRGSAGSRAAVGATQCVRESQLRR